MVPKIFLALPLLLEIQIKSLQGFLPLLQSPRQNKMFTGNRESLCLGVGGKDLLPPVTQCSSMRASLCNTINWSGAFLSDHWPWPDLCLSALHTIRTALC